MRKQIKIVNRPNSAMIELVEKVQEAVLEGYRFKFEGNEQPYLQFNPGCMTAIFYMEKNGDSVETTEPQSEEKEDTEETPETEESENKEALKSLLYSTREYKELKAVAEEYGLTVPEKVYNPMALRKRLLEQL